MLKRRVREERSCEVDKGKEKEILGGGGRGFIG